MNELSDSWVNKCLFLKRGFPHCMTSFALFIPFIAANTSWNGNKTDIITKLALGLRKCFLSLFYEHRRMLWWQLGFLCFKNIPSNGIKTHSLGTEVAEMNLPSGDSGGYTASFSPPLQRDRGAQSESLFIPLWVPEQDFQCCVVFLGGNLSSSAPSVGSWAFVTSPSSTGLRTSQNIIPSSHKTGES